MSWTLFDTAMGAACIFSGLFVVDWFTHREPKAYEFPEPQKLTELDAEAQQLESWLDTYDERQLAAVERQLAAIECRDHGSCALSKGHLDDEGRVSERWHQDHVGRRWNNDTGEDTGR